MRLPLEDFFLDRACRDEAVDEAVFLLTIAPDARQGLLVGCGIPVWIEEHEAVRADEVEAAAASFRAEKEDELRAVGVVEFVDELLTLVHVHRAVETEAAVAAGAAQLVEDVERLGVVADQDDLIIGVLPDTGEHAVEDLHFAGVPGFDVAVAATSVFGDVIIGEELLATGEVGGEVEEVGVVAELFKHADCFEGLAALATEERFDVRALDKVVVEIHLEGGEVAKDDVFVFNGEVLGEDVVGTADDELVDESKEVAEAFVTFVAVGVCACGVTSTKDG